MSYTKGMSGDSWEELKNFAKWLIHNEIDIRLYKNKFIFHEIIFTEEGNIIHELTNTVMFKNVSTQNMFKLLMLLSEIEDEGNKQDE